MPILWSEINGATILSEETGNKPYKITVTIWVHAPYGYTSRLVKRIKSWIRRAISHRKLTELLVSWEEVRR